MTESTERDLQAQINELKAELRAMRHASAPPDESSRRDLLKNLGLAAAGAVAGTVAAGGTAQADTGDELILGVENTSSTSTMVRGTTEQTTHPIFSILEGDEQYPLANLQSVLQVVADGTKNNGVLSIVRSATSNGAPVAGVLGATNDEIVGYGLAGVGTYGLLASGTRATLVLDSSSDRVDAEPHEAGEIWYRNGSFSACVGEGTPGTWRTLAAPNSAGQFHLAAPTVRIYDSRPGFAPLSVVKGKMANEVERTIDARYSEAVPASTAGATPTAALVNLTVTDTDSVSGFMTLFENGTDWPGTSSINWDAQGRTIANTTVVALDAEGRFKVRCGAAPGLGAHVVIDVLGYWL
jgi:hypothetical protein